MFDIPFIPINTDTVKSLQCTFPSEKLFNLPVLSYLSSSVGLILCWLTEAKHDQDHFHTVLLKNVLSTTFFVKNTHPWKDCLNTFFNFICYFKNNAALQVCFAKNFGFFFFLGEMALFQHSIQGDQLYPPIYPFFRWSFSASRMSQSMTILLSLFNSR